MVRWHVPLLLTALWMASAAALYAGDGPVVLFENVEAFERDVLASSDSLWIVRDIAPPSLPAAWAVPGAIRRVCRRDTTTG